MKLEKGQLYKLVEFDRGFVVLHKDDELGGRNEVVPLIIADMNTIAEFMVRYNEFRTQGLHWREAFQRALYGAKIVDPGAPIPGAGADQIIKQ